MRWRSMAARWLGGVLLMSAATAAPLTMACLDRELRPLHPCVVSDYQARIPAPSNHVDLLFMVDNSNSMSQEQTALAREFPRLVSALASGDKDADGRRDFPPVDSLRVGVISSDMGTGGVEVSTCEEQPFGDDGILRTSGNTELPGCDASYPSFLKFRPPEGGAPDPDEIDAFAQDFKCIAKMGTGGCGFEQQLESALKALTPSTSETTFLMGTTGHGDGANDGFLREHSLLSIILVTDEDDCSVSNPELYSDSGRFADTPINLRCWQHGDAAVYPVDRYVDGFLALRERPSQLVYAAITGVPPDLIPESQSKLEYNPLLCNEGPGDSCDPRMKKKRDPSARPPQLQPSCSTENGKATPPQRIVSVAKRLEERGASSVVTSICQESFTPALDAIIDRIADSLFPCLPRELNPDSTGKVPCNVVEVLPTEGEHTSCSELPGRTSFDPVRRDPGTGGEICKITQVPRTELAVGSDDCEAPEDAKGWFYDDCSRETRRSCGEDGQRIAYTEGISPAPGAELRLECLQSAEDGASTDDGPRLGAPCDYGKLDGKRRCDGAASAQQLCCERRTRTWRRSCTSKAECTEAGLGGYSCPTRREAEQLGLSARVCVNPTCQ